MMLKPFRVKSDDGKTFYADDAPLGTLAVWYGSMPESNGKTNWTAILHRGDISVGHTIDRSEYPDRVRYEADRVRWLIGEIEKEPWILDYDADKHSDYVPCATPADHISQARDAVIEECAMVCDVLAKEHDELAATKGALFSKFGKHYRRAAARIRLLMPAPPEKPAGDVSDI